MNTSSLKILFFSSLIDLAGTHEAEFPLEQSIPLSELLTRLTEHFPRLNEWTGPMLYALNLQYASPDSLVSPGDELALMPPVQGG